MYPHHQRTIGRAVEGLRQDPALRAVIVAGSIAKGVAGTDCDVELLLGVTAEEIPRRGRARACTRLSREYSDYEGGYVDAKYVDVAFLDAAAARGSEPTRDAFRGAYPAWSSVEGLDQLIARVQTYPERERPDKMRRFYSQALLQLYFINHGPDYRLLRAKAAVDMVFFAGRLLLAHNRVLFPSAKRLMESVAALPEKPASFEELADRLLQFPSVDEARALMDCVNAFHDWGLDWDTALGIYTEDSEYRWLDGEPPLADS